MLAGAGSLLFGAGRAGHAAPPREAVPGWDALRASIDGDVVLKGAADYEHSKGSEGSAGVRDASYETATHACGHRGILWFEQLEQRLNGVTAVLLLKAVEGLIDKRGQ